MIMSDVTNFGIGDLKKESEFKKSIEANKKVLNDELNKKMIVLAKNLKETSKAKAKAEAINDKKDNDRTREALEEKKRALNTAFINLSDSSKNFDEVMAEINSVVAKDDLKIGDVIIENVLGTGANVVATANA